MSKNKGPDDKKVVSIVDRKPVSEEAVVDKEIVQFLEATLEQAKSGLIQQILVIKYNEETTTTPVSIIGAASYPEIVFTATEILKDQYKNELSLSCFVWNY